MTEKMERKVDKVTMHITSVKKGKPPKVVLPSWAISMQKKDDKLDAIRRIIEKKQYADEAVLLQIKIKEVLDS